jgi:hypothetical protein
MAQVVIPDGTKVRVRLEENLSSETAELGQTVDFLVTQEVRIGDSVVVANGAPATGTIVQVEPKRRMGRGGKLDFSIDRVQLVDGSWLSVRYTPQKVSGKGNGVKAGVITAGIAVVFWPAAPLGLLVKGHDAVINKGRTYDVFADTNTYVANAVAANSPYMVRMMPQAPATLLRAANGSAVDNGGLPAGVNVPVNPAMVSNVSMTNASPAQPVGAEEFSQAMAMLSISANQAGADIEVDGNFVGSTPTTIQIAAGVHQITVRQGASQWQRNIRITGGTVNVNATLSGTDLRLASR